MIASSMVQLGLSWWQSWICVWVGYGVVAPFIALNARPGAIFHVTFPVVARTSFGVYGSLWCTFNRGAMAWCVTYINIKIWLYCANSRPVCGTVFRRVLVVTALRLCSALCGLASMTSVSVVSP